VFMLDLPAPATTGTHKAVEHPAQLTSRSSRDSHSSSKQFDGTSLR
jgi:hypothetical protein